MWWKIHKWKIILPAVLAVILAAAFWYGGGAPGLQGWTVARPTAPPLPDPTPTLTRPSPSLSTPVSTPAPSPTPSVTPSTTPSAPAPARPEEGLTAEGKVALAVQLAEGSSPDIKPGSLDYAKAQGMDIDEATGKDKYLTDPVPEGKPIPVEPQDATISDVSRTCTFSISCATILDNMDWLDPEKVELVPENGWIMEPTEVVFYEGESVFNVLQRTCKQNKIHMEFSNTPMYNSAYIEGIHNLYEFDCGELSGWMYQVNGWFPNYGCSRYVLQDGDVVEWEYTCNLGVDIGGFYSTGG